MMSSPWLPKFEDACRALVARVKAGAWYYAVRAVAEVMDMAVRHLLWCYGVKEVKFKKHCDELLRRHAPDVWKSLPKDIRAALLGVGAAYTWLYKAESADVDDFTSYFDALDYLMDELGFSLPPELARCWEELRERYMRIVGNELR